MSQQSSIEWTDATWNPVRGCTKVSPGCANCYAETFAERWRGIPGHPYEQGFDLRLVPEKLAEPLTWKKPRRVFVNSMSDLFQDGVPDAFIDQAFAVMALAKQHTFQVLTKRADRMRDYCSRLPHRGCNQFVSYPTFGSTSVLWGHADLQPWPLPNVWLGVSVENQRFADERIPLLLQTPAAVRFISAEPLLAPVLINSWLLSEHGRRQIGAMPGLSWVIVGGESGPGARPCQTWWIRNLVRQCQQADVPVFVKQFGSLVLVPACRQSHWDYRFVDRPETARFTGFSAESWRMRLRHAKGGDMAEWPADLRVREFPARPPRAATREEA